MLRSLLILIFCLLSAQGIAQPVARFNDETLYYSDTLKWLYFPGDAPAMAQLNYDDHAWQLVDPKLNMEDTSIARSFKSICWFRLHFQIDSSLFNQPLALIMEHDGASEIFLDGVHVWGHGAIDEHERIAYNPLTIPAVFTAPSSPGVHVIAIRYANSNPFYKYKRFSRRSAGISVELAHANSAINTYANNKLTITGVAALLAGLFAALGFLHLILFFYQRRDLSNLYFSTFCFGISGCALLPLLMYVIPSPGFGNKCQVALIVCMALSALSLNGFTSFLFTTNKWRFRVALVVGVINMIILCFSIKFAVGFSIGLIVYAAVEAMRLMVVGIIRKIEGSQIIAAGLSMFILILLTIIFAGILLRNRGGMSLTGNTALIWLSACVISVLSIPISFSVFLAKRFARINKTLSAQLVQVQLLSEKTIEQEAEKQKILENKKTELEAEVKLRTAEVVQQKDEIEQQHNELKDAKKKSDDLLLNILPSEIAEELKETGHSDARLYNDVTVLFTDFVDFTIISEQLSPTELVAEIDQCFKAFDEIIGRFGLEKIKTIGDAYLAVCGLPINNKNHAAATLNAALAIRDFMLERKKQHQNTFEIRLGIHSGSVIAGIVGLKKFAYDIWGDTVNTAARMEQSGEAGKVNISGATYKLVKDQFAFTYRGELQAKNKGKMDMYFVEEAVVISTP